MSGFVDSNYKFTDPVRFFKENDPYYWEVDNLPLKQIHENSLWLKDQILGQDQVAGVSRSDFNELKPSVEGGNNKVLVQPGRFTARINDAYTKSPMQRLLMLQGADLGTFERYGNPAGNAIAQDILDSLSQEVTNQFDGLNGLVERVLSWPMTDEDNPLTQISTSGSLPTYLTSPDLNWMLKNQAFVTSLVQSYGVASELQKMSVEFTRQFRGVGRTAIVDIPEQLSIEIPNFSDEDFVYYENGVKQYISGAQSRIDLLFIYSKPIDASATTIQKWSGGQPTTITTPILGLVKGAGVAITHTGSENSFPLTQGLSNEGHTQILPNVADQSVTTNGFQASGIHGSFPSPDDLMNLAPLISEKLLDSDPQLIGQSILPIAYIIVNKNADINAVGNIVLTDSDIFDIRPFFRTTELTNNERGGLMAATPPTSLANPVVTQFGLDRESVRMKTYVDELFSGGLPEHPRVVGGGVIWGGLTYGPEGAINNILTTHGVTENVFTSEEVPALPDWDVAEWWDFDFGSISNDGANKGQLRNDRINFYTKASNANLDGGVGIPAGFIGIIENETAGTSTGNLLISWIKKRIPINKENVSWMSDYLVRVQIENCVGLTSISDGTQSITRGHGYGVWVERLDSEFIIYVAWAANKISDSDVDYPQYDRSHGRHTQWVAKSSTFPNPTSSHQSFLAACTYPTVSFEVIGYPADWLNKSLAQYPNTPLLNLE